MDGLFHFETQSIVRGGRLVVALVGGDVNSKQMTDLK